MEDRILLAALAGLLHDVGKFAQRAGEQVSAEWSEGKTKADFGYQHALHSWHFVNKYLPNAFRPAGTMAAFHHRPKGRGTVVQLADHLAAGERRKDEPDDSNRKTHPKQLHPVFIGIQADDQSHPCKGQDKFYFPLQPFALDQDIVFASENPVREGEVWDQYKALWNAFCTASEKLRVAMEQNQNGEAYLESMLSLLHRYTWCIPSAYFNAIPDISLYDHSRMTAALAAVMADEDEFPEDCLKQIAYDPESSSEPVALLVGGDISGVQDFIYTITNKGATSALRGRSFYLQLLTEAVARFALRELGLPYTNLIYGGGGNFYILARRTDQEKLLILRQKLSRILYQHHQGDLYIAIAGLPLMVKDFMRPSNGKHPLSEKWGELARRLAKAKNQRFSELSEAELQVIFAAQGHGGNQEKECQVCGREHPNTTGRTKPGTDDEVRKCPACRSYEELGKSLRDAEYIGWQIFNHPAELAPLRSGEFPGTFEEALQALGFAAKPAHTQAELAKSDHLWALSDQSFAEARPNAKQVLMRRLLVNTTPHLSEDFKSSDGQEFKQGDIKPFEKLVADSEGIKRLGVLRMDVDNLGKLFESGLGNDATLSRIAALSSAISLYFDGWVGQLAERNKDKVYAIYSGGDDLFFVGAWDEVAELAREIRRDLAKYVGYHPGIHASGGLVLVDDKYPLAKAAEDAAQAEEHAKNLKWWDEKGQPHEKDALCFLGQPLPWARVGYSGKDDLDTAYGMMGHLKAIENQSVVRTLLRHYEQYAEANAKRQAEGADRDRNARPQVLFGPWNWRIVYTLKRNLKDDATLIEKFHAEPAMMEWVGLAARWAELINRNSTKEE